MSRLVNRPVRIRLSPEGRPLFLEGRPVRILEEWRESGRWWLGEAERQVFRLEGPEGGIYEVTRQEGERVWRLTRIFD